MFPICYQDDYIKEDDEMDGAWKRKEIHEKCKPENMMGKEQWDI